MNCPLRARIESIGGAVALGEATDEERREYREHIATCAPCLSQLGGEREIERAAGVVADAREGEVWQPNLRDVVARGIGRRRRAAGFALGIAAACAAVSLAVHLLAASTIPRISSSMTTPVVIDAGATQIVLERRAPAVAKSPAPAARQRRMIVEHNIVQIARAPLPAQPPAATPPDANPKPAQIAAVTVHPLPQAQTSTAHSDVPIWRRNDGDTWRTVARTTTTSLSESAPQSLTHTAESIEVVSSRETRDAVPVGGETAINPQPAMIAYDEGAQGTSVFEVLVDERGTPTKCVITKSAGYAVLDEAVCKAAMQARYVPKTIDGRPVAGTYRDAFTFRMSSDDQSIEGVPKPIQ